MAQCPTCGAAVESVPGRCRKCGAVLNAPATAQPQFVGTAVASAPVTVATPMPSFAGLSGYYQNEFNKIYSSQEAYKGRWNWAAFFFGPLWALTKGVWLSAIICFVLCLATSGLLVLPLAIVYGIRGNYIYYTNFAKAKQLVF